MQSESALQHASEKFVTDLLSVGTEAHPAPPTLKLSNLAAPDWSIGESSLAYIAQSYSQKNTQIDLCPFESPFVNAGGQCIACVYYFDLSKRECTACKDFSDATHSCLDVKATNKTTGNDTSKNKTQQTHITNPGTAPNIILEGISKNQWMTEYYNNMTSNHQLSDCPTATPFFDGTACINCPNAKPYFDLLYMVCTACP